MNTKLAPMCCLGPVDSYDPCIIGLLCNSTDTASYPGNIQCENISVLMLPEH